MDEEADEIEGAGVSPLDVLDDDEQRLCLGQALGDGQQRLEEPGPVELAAFTAGRPAFLRARLARDRRHGELGEQPSDDVARRPDERADDARAGPGRRADRSASTNGR